MKAFAHSVSSSLSIFTYSSNLNSDISYFMEPFSIPLAEAVGLSLRAPTERTAAIAFVVITCLFFNLLSQNEFLKCKSGISCFLMPHCLAQFWNIVEKNSSNLLNEPICLLDLISHNTSPQYHTYILLCFRHRGLFTTLKSVKFCTTIVLFKELYLSALPISGARQNIFIDTQYRRPIVCCICRDSWELPLWPEPLPSECLPLHHSPVLFNFQMLLRKIDQCAEGLGRAETHSVFGEQYIVLCDFSSNMRTKELADEADVLVVARFSSRWLKTQNSSGWL